MPSSKDHGADGRRAGLILARGVSACGAWIFKASDAGTTIVIGAASTCDWQIAAPDITPVFVSFTGESLLVRALAHDSRIMLNGHTLPPQGWVQLAHGDELQLGPSVLAARLVPSLRQGKGARPPKAKKMKASAPRSRAPQSGAPSAQLALHRAFTDDAPALFQERDQAQHEPRMWYAAVALGTLLTYAVWLAFLDQF